MPRPTRALIDLEAICHNYRLACALAQESRALAVVKADAYGHGMVPVARALQGLAPAYATASIDEALALRAGGIEEPVLVLEGFFYPDELELAAAYDFWLAVENERQLSMLETATLPLPVTVWLKVDSGMHRLGVALHQVRAFHERLQAAPAVARDIVLMTHFACADEVERSVTRAQIAAFEAACAGLPGQRSLCNSPGLMQWPEAHADWVRPGFMLYGSSPLLAPDTVPLPLRPAMTFTSTVISLRQVAPGERVGYGGRWEAQRESRIATLAVGYGDGYPRHARDGTPVLLNGQRAPLAGRVSMDLITVDVTDIAGISLGDTAVLWGEGLDVSEVAAHADTIGYALLAGMPARTPRIYPERQVQDCT